MHIKIISCNDSSFNSKYSNFLDCSESSIDELLNRVFSIEAIIDFNQFLIGVKFKRDIVKLALIDNSKSSIEVNFSLRKVEILTKQSFLYSQRKQFTIQLKPKD